MSMKQKQSDAHMGTLTPNLTRPDIERFYSLYRKDLSTNSLSLVDYQIQLLMLSQFATQCDLPEESRRIEREVQVLGNPNDIKSMFRWILKYQKPEDYYSWFKWAIVNFPDNSLLHKLIADALLRNFERTEAIRDECIQFYSKAIQFNNFPEQDSMKECLISYADLCLRTKQYELASAHYSKAIKFATNSLQKEKLKRLHQYSSSVHALNEQLKTSYSKYQETRFLDALEILNSETHDYDLSVYLKLGQQKFEEAEENLKNHIALAPSEESNILLKYIRYCLVHLEAQFPYLSERQIDTYVDTASKNFRIVESSKYGFIKTSKLRKRLQAFLFDSTTFAATWNSDPSAGFDKIKITLWDYFITYRDYHFLQCYEIFLEDTNTDLMTGALLLLFRKFDTAEEWYRSYIHSARDLPSTLRTLQDHISHLVDSRAIVSSAMTSYSFFWKKFFEKYQIPHDKEFQKLLNTIYLQGTTCQDRMHLPTLFIYTRLEPPPSSVLPQEMVAEWKLEFDT